MKTLILIALVLPQLVAGCAESKDSKQSMDKLPKTLPSECQAYLDAGPPKHMTDYMPESLTEIIIAHGAQSKQLDPELAEIASIISEEADDFESIKDAEIKAYMVHGVELVKRVLDSQTP